MSNVLAFQKRTAEKPEASGKGFALIHRKIKELEFYKSDSEAVHLWLHLILSVNYSPVTVASDYGDVVVGRGQLITGAPTLARETGLDVERVKYLLKKFRKLGMISTWSPGKFSIITVEKYSEYQGEITPKSFPQVSPEIPSDNSGMARLTEQPVPYDSLKFPTNNNITNNSLPNGNESPSAHAEDLSSQDEGLTPEVKQKPPALSCQTVLDVYHQVLPEAKNVRLLSDKRRNQIRTFWKKASKITRQLDGVPFTLDSWREYLVYISENCRWMLEDRQDHRSGKVWHRKGLEYFLNDETYLQVREGAKDDR